MAAGGEGGADLLDMFEEQTHTPDSGEAPVDPTTGLPALHAVLDDVQKRVEAGERIGLIYLDLSTEARLESIYGWQTYDNLISQVAEVIQSFVRDELESPDLAIACRNRGEEFLVLTAIPRNAEGEAILAERQASLERRLRARLQVQFDNEDPRPLLFESSIIPIPLDPMVRIERSLYRSLEVVQRNCRLLKDERHNERLVELRRIVATEDLEVRFQPIVRLRDGAVHGFEALTCGPKGSAFENPEMLFSYAEETDHIHDLERICRVKSISQARALESGKKLFLNCSARVLAQPGPLCEDLLEQAELCGLRPSDIVLEITERVAITAWQDFRRSVAALRLTGFPIAIDDVGSGYSSLKSIAEVQPDYLKVDLSLVRDVDKSDLKKSLLDSLLSVASSISAEIIAEGVETAEEYQELKSRDVPFGQGYYFARPRKSYQSSGL